MGISDVRYVPQTLDQIAMGGRFQGSKNGDRFSWADFQGVENGDRFQEA